MQHMPRVRRAATESLEPQEERTPAVYEDAHEQTAVQADRAAWEQQAEVRDDLLHAESQPELEALKEAPSAQVAAAPSAVAGKDEVIIEVENILEEGLGEFYTSLPEDARPLFKKKGEEVSLEIAEMVRTFRFRVGRAFELITDWLKTIPGVNRFFLEQEAKIKTDRLVQLVQTRRGDDHL